MKEIQIKTRGHWTCPLISRTLRRCRMYISERGKLKVLGSGQPKPIEGMNRE